MFKTPAIIKQIGIAEPCSQSWNDMNPINGGRHCDSCCKTVIDFTVMSNEHIIATLMNHGNLCGRLEEWQINSINGQLQTQPRHWFNLKGLIIATSLLLAVANSFGQSKLKTKKTHDKQLKVKAKRSRIDSLVTYYPGIKLTEPYVINIPVKLDTLNTARFEIPRESAVLGGVQIAGLTVNSITQRNQPVGYFRSIEDMMQAVQ